jgi:tyrosyl-tRNA synthetase
MTLSEELAWRGFIKDKTFDDITWLDEPKTFYLGADVGSADSLTIGNLAIYMLARRLAKAGWKTVLLVGGATSLIGDPGGKEEERDLKSLEEVQHNVAGIEAQVRRLFEGYDFKLVNNYDWFKDIGYLEFLREVGKYYSMTELVQRDFISTRMGEGGSGISYAEFSYNLIQGYDYWYLFKHHGVVLQIGGSDQWGNMLSGAPLIRKREGQEVHALSMPLVINKATGVKFGKSEAGAVWLDANKTTPTQFYQFWINCDDAGVEDYLKVFTEFSQDEIAGIMSEHSGNPAARVAQIRLAASVTELIHGHDAMLTAQAVTNYLTGAADIGEADDGALSALRQEIPAVKTASVVEALVTSGLASSNTEARRFLAENAISLNGQKINREQFEDQDFHNGRAMLRRGKAYKDSALVEK